MKHSAIKSFIHRLALTLLLAASVISGRAAEAVKVRLLAFSRVGNETEVGIVDADGKPLAKKPVALPTQQLSESTEIASRALVFTAPDDAKKILGKVTLPASGAEFILVFLPASEGTQPPYQIDAVALPSSEFHGGDYAFINYSGSAVGSVIDGEKLQIPHGKCTIYKAMESGKKPGNRPMVCYRQKDGVWETTPFYSSRIIVQEGVRNLVFICLDPRSGAIDFRGIADFVDR